MANIHRNLTTSLIAVLVGVSALALTPARSSADVSWSSYAGPDHLYIDQDQTLTFHIHNDGAMDLDIWNYYVYFDWDFYTTRHTLVNSSRVTVPAGADSKYYTLPIHVHVWAGSHSANIYCSGQVNGDPRIWDGSWVFSFTMVTVPILTISSIDANPRFGGAPLSVDFSATPSGGLPPYSYSWAFGDGGTSTDATPSHVYRAAGNYTAIVTVADTEYVDQVITAKVTVTVIWMALSVTGTVSTTPGALSVAFECSPLGGNCNYSYSWDFGDQSNNSYEQNPTHQYSVAGTYSVRVTLRDTGGNRTEWGTTVTVPPVATPPDTEHPTGSALTSSFIAGAIIVVVGVATIVVLLVLMLRQRGSGRQ